MEKALNRINFHKKVISELTTKMNEYIRKKETYIKQIQNIQRIIDECARDIAMRSEQLKLAEYDYKSIVEEKKRLLDDPIIVIHELVWHQNHFVEKKCSVVSKNKKSKRNNMLIK